MHVLILWMFNIVAAPAPYEGPVIPPLKPGVEYVVPATIATAEFSSLTACDVGAQAAIAAIRKQAEPALVHVGYKCVKKA